MWSVWLVPKRLAKMPTLDRVRLFMLETKSNDYRGQAPRNDITFADAIGSSIRFARRQRRVIISSVLVLVTLGALYTFLTPSRYKAIAVISADLSRQEINPPQQQAAGPGPEDPTEVDSQVEVFRSLSVLLPVVEQLKLREDPEFSDKGSLLGGPQQGDQAELSSLLEKLEKALQVKRVGKTHIIEVLFTARNPNRAAEVANAISNSFIQDRLQAKYEAAQRAIAWLHNRLTELKRQVSAAEVDIERFKSSHVLPGELIAQQLSELRSRRAAIQAEVANADAMLGRIDSIMRSDFSTAAVDQGILEASHDLAKLRSRYLDLVNQEAELTSAASHDHPAEVNVRKQIEQLRASIKEELKRIAASYKSNHEIAKTKERAIQEELSKKESILQGEKEYQTKLRELENTAKNLRTTYDDNASFFQRDIELLQQQSMPTSGARIISLALPPLWRSSPRASLMVGGAALAGILLGFAIGLFRDMTDRTCRSREQIEALLGVPCITMIPKLGANPNKQALRTSNRPSSKKRSIISLLRSTKSLSRPTPEFSNAHDYIASLANATPISPEPFSFRFSEAIRTIGLSLGQAHSSSQIIGVTSALPNEGKSTIIAYLARLLAQSGSRVILVDCDLRAGKLTKVLAEQAPHGLREVMMGQISTQTAITQHDAGFAFMAAGKGACPTHPNEIFAMAKSDRLFDELRKSFDYILLDLPPLGPIADVVAIGKFVDLYLFVIEWGGTPTQVVQQALSEAQVVRNNLLGVVFNKVDLESLADYERSYYNYDDYRGNRCRSTLR
jgi:succinoglycan biosynthesis transport protein ExoP